MVYTNAAKSVRIDKLREKILRVMEGKCPHCGERIRLTSQETEWLDAAMEYRKKQQLE